MRMESVKAMPIVTTKRKDILREDELRGMLDKLEGKESLQGQYMLQKRYTKGKKEGERIVQTFNIDCRKTECLLCLLWIFGKRITELLLLKRKDVTVGGGFLTVKFHVLKKPKETIPVRYMKSITLNHPYTKYIIQYVNTVKDPDEFLFPGNSGERTFVSKVRNKKTGKVKVYEYTREEHGFMSAHLAWKIVKFLNPKSYPHLFRHSLATIMAENRYTQHQLMSWFDWSNPTVAFEYVKKGPGLTKEASRRTW